jgi:ribonuclease HI
MPWARKFFKGGKVYALVDDSGALVVKNGRVDIKYREDDERTYRASAENLGDAPEEEPETERTSPAPGPAHPRASSVRVGDRPRADGIVIYTDGACTGNPGPAGIGAVMIYRGNRKEISEYLGKATSNIAELTAVLRALQAVKNPELPVDICMDSAYSIGVLARGWKAKANLGLIAEIQRELSRFRDLRFVKVRGHSGIPENERADELAREAVARGTR